MQTYYHDTTANNPDNSILGYITDDGDFIKKADYQDLLDNAIDGEQEPDIFGSWLAIKVVVQKGLLAAYPIEEFYEHVRKDAVKYFKN